jgi:hypothetical protein
MRRESPDPTAAAGPKPMRRSALLPVLAALSGCVGGGPAPLPTGSVSAYFAAGGIADTIDINALDRLPLRGAQLVAPDGRTTEAEAIVARPAPSSGVSVALPSGGVSGVGAIGAEAPAPAAVGAGVQSHSVLLATLSNATLTLTDPVAYRRDWRHYRIRLRFGDPPDVETRDIDAPAPPPNPTG